jgi:Rrf2 family protein
MKLSTRARYSVRLMIYLADNAGNGEPVQLGEIARNQALSLRYLEQLVMPLKSANLIKSVHGKHGGYFLSRDPGLITINEIIEASIGPIRLLDCLGSDTECGFENHCGSRRMWGLINHKITDVLMQYTLEDLSEKNMHLMPPEPEVPAEKSRARTC